jgi:hypothetical protein
VVFFPKGIVGAEFNFYGPRLSRLEEYLHRKFPDLPLQHALAERHGRTDTTHGRCPDDSAKLTPGLPRTVATRQCKPPGCCEGERRTIVTANHRDLLARGATGSNWLGSWRS